MMEIGMWEEVVRQAQQPPSRQELERIEYLKQMQEERAEARREARSVIAARRSGGWLNRRDRQPRRPESGSGAAA